MKHIIEIDDEQPNGMLVIELLKDLNLDYKHIKSNKLIGAKLLSQIVTPPSVPALG